MGLRAAAAVGAFLLLPMLGAMTGEPPATDPSTTPSTTEPPATITLFAAAAWYRQAEAPEQTFEGLLQKQPAPMATSGRRHPLRLASAQGSALPIYLGGDHSRLDAYLGERVRIEGKVVTVLGQPELWPARLTPLGGRQQR